MIGVRGCLWRPPQWVSSHQSRSLPPAWGWPLPSHTYHVWDGYESSLWDGTFFLLWEEPQTTYWFQFLPALFWFAMIFHSSLIGFLKLVLFSIHILIKVFSYFPPWRNLLFLETFLFSDQLGHREQCPKICVLLWYLSDINRHVWYSWFSDSGKKALHYITIRTMKGIPCFLDLPGTGLNCSPLLAYLKFLREPWQTNLLFVKSVY